MKRQYLHKYYAKAIRTNLPPTAYSQVLVHTGEWPGAPGDRPLPWSNVTTLGCYYRDMSTSTHPLPDFFPCDKQSGLWSIMRNDTSSTM